MTAQAAVPDRARREECEAMFWFKKTPEMPTADTALKGRPQAIPTAQTHFVNGAPLQGPYPAGLESAVFALGCFWGTERKFWTVP
ncbi:MAG: hypothetical protein B7Y70_04805, partial [Rhizobiales bacterium 35-68-8]